MKATGTVGSTMKVGILARIKQFRGNPKTLLLRTLRFSLNAEERLARFTGPRGYWFQLRAYQLAFLVGRGLTPQARLLDIGCGPLQGGIAFIDHLAPNRYVGVDLLATPLAEGYRLIARYGLAAKNPRLIHSTTFGLEELSEARFDFAWACQMLYHLKPPALDKLFETLSLLLKPGGRLYGDVLAQSSTLSEKSTWNGLEHTKHTLEALEAGARAHGLVMKALGPIADHGYPVPCGLRSNEMLEFSKDP